jgi:glycosidase
MTVSATLGKGPVMIYFGQEVGEPGAEETGFGDPTRTTIFDYAGVPHHQRWMNMGAFDGGQLSTEEKALRDFYQRLLTFTRQSTALQGEFFDLHASNRANAASYGEPAYAFARYQGEEKLIIITNFSAEESLNFTLEIPGPLLALWDLQDGQYQTLEQLYGKQNPTLLVDEQKGQLLLQLAPLGSLILRIEP